MIGFNISEHGCRCIKVVDHYARGSEAFSVLAIRIATGRRHQIRVHTAHVGHPTVCDGRYTSTATFLSDQAWCPRNFLHRSRLVFSAPCASTGGVSCTGATTKAQLVEATAPCPQDLAEALAELRPAAIEGERDEVAAAETATSERRWARATAAWTEADR
ncbi:unnamed protein product [Polarella glacialis]|uniref:Pseudouridine synthase RsuA/RluA-like domain-containing protein n=1 Tax=Polarella glacialis TaxID=89957 RepID=A0A813DDP6_POLGL|nr:unnamed protein product [Polarella glacialis]